MQTMKKLTRTEIKNDPEDMVHLILKVPQFPSWKELNDYFRREYHFTVTVCDCDPESAEEAEKCTCEESDEFERIYYNADLRSDMGFLWGDSDGMQDPGKEIEMVLYPEYYMKGKEWKSMWDKLVDNCRAYIPRESEEEIDL
jgi:hypothetical protein